MHSPVRLLGTLLGFAAMAVIVIGLVAGEDREADRVEALGKSLRCPVCRGLSVNDSESTTARKLRQIIADQVAAGATDQDVRDWFVDRYGEWALLDPPVEGRGLLLWAMPVLGLAVGVAATASRRRRPEHAAPPAEPGAAEPAEPEAEPAAQ